LVELDESRRKDLDQSMKNQEKVVIHRVVLAGFTVEPRKTEQLDAQNSVFKNSVGL
jgi:hypothetical protein